jgi:phosphoribosylglycinamide formyltransferase-1
MRILGDPFVQRYAGRMLNIHPSLLPAYRGLDTHRRVIAAGEKTHGCTVHFVTAELDGGPRIAQGPVAVLPGDTPDTLAARVLDVEHLIYPLATQLVASGRLRCDRDRATLDGDLLERPLMLVDGTLMRC